MKAKPFIKWAGGKGQLIEQLESLLPSNFDQWDDVTYIEPFVGGGAMLFYMLQTHPNIRTAIINDINEDLTKCYCVIKDKPTELIESLTELQKEYYSINTETQRKEFYLSKRKEFNTKQLDSVKNTTLFIFLNKTCFNGLYRVNRSGLFNVPFGKYNKPTICDPDTIHADSEILQNVEILTGDFPLTAEYATGNTLFYLDPPYRPLSETSSFNDYAKEAFNDYDQVRLKNFCDHIDAAGFSFMLSNSDCFNTPKKDPFFEELYSQYVIDRVWATRSVNANPLKRGSLQEILVHNFI